MAKVLDNKCPSCGAAIHFKPELGKFKCDYCDSEFSAEELKDMDKIKKEDLKDLSGENTDSYIDYVNYNCPDCGAEIITDSNTAATFCVYCGNTAIIKNRLSGEFAPKYIIPFKIEKNKAIDAFKRLRKGRPLVPKSFVSEKNIEKITGVYIPFWLYNITVSGTINAKATKVKSWTSGDTHYTKTDYFNVVRSGNMDFHRVPVDGSTRFNNEMMNSIEPFDYGKLIDYNHAYLSGFLAEKYDISSDDAFIDAKERTLNSTREEMLNSMVGYSGKTITSNDLKSKYDDLEYVLLPVWMVNVKYNDKFYLFAMNGESGKFIGDIPLDKKKAILICIFVFIFSFLLCVLFSYLIFLGR
jgi:DNA-directed RNA polymerase subunit RPC12/RpoP